MNKKLIALAVAGAVYAPTVMAQSANPVTLYGRIWLMAESVKADGGASTAVAIANPLELQTAPGRTFKVGANYQF